MGRHTDIHTHAKAVSHSWHSDGAVGKALLYKPPVVDSNPTYSCVCEICFHREQLNNSTPSTLSLSFPVYLFL